MTEVAIEALAGAEGCEARARLAALGLGEEALRALRIGLHPGEALRSRLPQGLRALARELGLFSDRLGGKVLYPAQDEQGKLWTIYASGTGAADRTLSLRGSGLPRVPVFLDRALAAGERDLILVQEVREAACLQAQGRIGAVASIAPRLSRSQVQALVRAGIRTVEIRLGSHAGREGEAECVRALEAAGIATRLASASRSSLLEGDPRPEGRQAGTALVQSEAPGPRGATLAGFEVKVVAEVTEDDGDKPNHHYELSATRGRESRRFRVPRDELTDLGWVARELGAPGQVISPGSVLEALRSESKRVPRTVVFTHLGWARIGSEWVYLHAGGAIGRTGPVPGIEVRVGRDLEGLSLPFPSEVDGVRRSLRASLALLDLAPATVTFPLHAAIWRAALGEAGDWSLHVQGDHGRELVVLALEHWGPRAAEPPGASAPDRAFRAKDCLILSEGAEQGGRRPRSLRASCAVSPELATLSPGLGLRLGSREVALERLGSCRAEATAGRLGEALAGFVSWLAGNDPRGRCETLLSASSAAGPGEGRIGAELELAFELFVHFATEAGALDRSARAALLGRARDAISAAVRLPALEAHDRDPVRQLFRVLAAAISSGRAHVAGLDGGAPARSPFSWGWRPTGHGASWAAQGTRVGWTAGEDLYLDRAVIASLTRELLDHEDAPSSRALGELFSRSGLLRSFDPDRETFGSRRVLAGSRRTVLHVSVDVLQPREPGARPDSQDRR